MWNYFFLLMKWNWKKKSRMGVKTLVVERMRQGDGKYGFRWRVLSLHWKLYHQTNIAKINPYFKSIGWFLLVGSQDSGEVPAPFAPWAHRLHGGLPFLWQRWVSCWELFTPWEKACLTPWLHPSLTKKTLVAIYVLPQVSTALSLKG